VVELARTFVFYNRVTALFLSSSMASCSSFLSSLGSPPLHHWSSPLRVALVRPCLPLLLNQGDWIVPLFTPSWLGVWQRIFVPQFHSTPPLRSNTHPLDFIWTCGSWGRAYISQLSCVCCGPVTKLCQKECENKWCRLQSLSFPIMDLSLVLSSFHGTRTRKWWWGIFNRKDEGNNPEMAEHQDGRAVGLLTSCQMELNHLDLKQN
jgi:hypothetical protein